jgi:inorganic pyrophosphatase
MKAHPPKVDLFARIPVRDPESGMVNVIVDTPRGSQNKYKYDETLGVYTISRILPIGMLFPYDFGSIPNTRAQDGDPLDVMIVSEAPSFVGCLIKVRLIGGFKARQKEKGRWIRNDRLLGVPETPSNPAEIHGLDELAEREISGIEQFFVSYNRAQGRELQVTGRFGIREANRLLVAALNV